MNYEEKYKEIVGQLKKAYLYAQTDSTKAVLEEILPELAESEDKKMRKALISILKSDFEKDTTIYNISVGDMLAWLEKQNSNVNNANKEYWRGYRESKQEILDKYAELEKQGEPSDKTHYWTEEEIEPIISDYLRGAEHYGGMIGRLRCLKPKSLEKQGDSPIKWNKNTEDCKPKVNHSVLMKTTHSIAEGEWKGEYWEQYRWAGIVRDSDVLSWMELSDLDKQGEQKPTLRERYKNIAESEWFKKTHDGMSVSDDEEPKWTDDEKIRKWLIEYFDKINDEIDKQDRVKILAWLEKQAEQKPAEWKQENVEELSEFENLMMHIGYSFFGKRGGLDPNDTSSVKVQAQYLLELAQKPAEWSEDDERMLHTIIADFKGFIRDNTSTLESHFNECIDWLKSIKNRVQPEQEWSEEDENGLGDALWAIKQARTIAKDENDMGNLWYAEKWLKSLRPQNTWKPSDDEIEKASQEWDSKAIFNPFYMTMDGDKPTGVKQDITTHKESFKAGVEWILKKIGF